MSRPTVFCSSKPILGLSACLVASPHVPLSLTVNGQHLCPPWVAPSSLIAFTCSSSPVPCPSSLVYLSCAVTPLFCHIWCPIESPVLPSASLQVSMFRPRYFFCLLPCWVSRLFGFSFPVQLLIVSSVDSCLSFLNYHIPRAPFLCCTQWSNKSRLKSLLPRQSAFGFLFCLPCGTLTLTNKNFGVDFFHVSLGWRPD